MDAKAVTELLQGVPLADGQERLELAAHLSKIAAKAEDPVLLILGTASASFVEWLETPDPLVKAYTACILANVAFLGEGQDRVKAAGGIAPLLALLRDKHASKVTLHAAAAVQNLTFKSEPCCRVVMQLKGEKMLKKLYNHASADVQQFAAGALANLQLYRSGGDEAEPAPAPAKKGKKKKGRGAAGSAAGAEEVRAAVVIQAACRGRMGRQRYADLKRRHDKKKPRYETFSVHAVRSEFESGQGTGRAARGSLPLSPMGGRVPLAAPGGLAPRGVHSGKLSPIGALPPIGGGSSNSISSLPPLGGSRLAPSSLSPGMGMRSALMPVR